MKTAAIFLIITILPSLAPAFSGAPFFGAAESEIQRSGSSTRYDGPPQFTAGKIYVVYCVDTEPPYISELPGDPIPYHGTIDTGAFDNNPSNPMYQNLQPDWREFTLDSYGGHIKFSWFLLASEMECQSNLGNCLITFDLMETFSEVLATTGDELGWHFHNTDWQLLPEKSYSGAWVQLDYFNETPAFDRSPVQIAEAIMNQLIIEKNWFPSSFRSGWTWEDDDLSNWLEQVVLFDYSRLTPLASNYDWSRSPAWPEFSYYHPSATDYQSIGSMERFLVQSYPYIDVSNDTRLQEAVDWALAGQDVIFSVYSHAPSDLVTKGLVLDSLINEAKTLYGPQGLEIRYCTASEAMRLIKGVENSSPLSVDASYDGNKFSFTIKDSTLGAYPYVALKFQDGTYYRLHGTETEPNLFEFDATHVHRPAITRVGVAFSDLAGNVTVNVYDPQDLTEIDLTPDCGEPYFDKKTGRWITIPCP